MKDISLSAESLFVSGFLITNLILYKKYCKGITLSNYYKNT